MRRAGQVTMAGNKTISNNTTNSASMNGHTPLIRSSMEMRDTPATTLSTVPTGGVISPIELFTMNSTPKYTGSMPACLMTGIKMGVSTRMVGVMSIAVPTITTSSMMASSSKVGLSMRGLSNSTTASATSDTVISQAETSAAATRNMMTAVVLAAVTNTPYNWEGFNSR